MLKSNKYQYFINQADGFVRVGRLRQAEELLVKILRSLPKHHQAHCKLGCVLLRLGKTKEAVDSFKIACSLQPKNIQYWVRLVGACQQGKNQTQLVSAIESAIQAGVPEHVIDRLAEAAFTPSAERQHYLLSLYQNGSNPLTTEIAASMFIEDYPDHPLGWQILGALLHDRGRLDEALRLRKQTVEDFPNDGNAFNNLAVTQLALNDYVGALRSSRQALKIAPNLQQAKEHERLALAGLQRKSDKRSVS